VSEREEGAALVAAMRADYVARLPEKIAALYASLSAKAWADARRDAHKLRGSAGVYGVPSVSEAAGRLEDVLDASSVDGRPDEAAVLQAARELAAAVDDAAMGMIP
jgi:HPt (histidine-containing phosphotransfer) domain-containing protein